MRGKRKSFAAAQRSSSGARGNFERNAFKARISASALRSCRTAKYHAGQNACPVRPHIDPDQYIGTNIIRICAWQRSRRHHAGGGKVMLRMAVSIL
jgi:hypothetical protein